MKKKRRTGASHYRQRLGLKPIVVYVDKSIHRKLLKRSAKEGSLQKLARRILEGYVKTHEC